MGWGSNFSASPLFSSANLKISMLSISSSKNSCLDRIKIPFFFYWTYFDNFLSTDECIKIVNSFEDNKSAEIDGLGKSFYSRFWLIIGKDLVEVLNNIYFQSLRTAVLYFLFSILLSK
jgi:hypothetical protein